MIINDYGDDDEEGEEDEDDEEGEEDEDEEQHTKRANTMRSTKYWE
jgi:hypothetical protein